MSQPPAAPAHRSDDDRSACVGSIRPVRGNLLTAQVEALVNPVNCVGVMGRGLALQFKKAYPANFAAYQQACTAGRLIPGTMLIHDHGPGTTPRYIINFPTKRHWRDRSVLADIERGLSALVRDIRERGIGSIAIPPLGCGLGGLPWEQVRPLILAAFVDVPQVDVHLYQPAEAPPCGGAQEMVKPSSAEARVVDAMEDPGA